LTITSISKIRGGFRIHNVGKADKKITLEDLELKHMWVVYHGKETYGLPEDVTVIPLEEIHETWFSAQLFFFQISESDTFIL